MTDKLSQFHEYCERNGIVDSIAVFAIWNDWQDIKEKYNELIMSVAKKFPNESRHETALRYIVERESFKAGEAKACQAST